LRNEKIGFKIREHTLQRIPYLLVVGDREMETETSPCAPARARPGQHEFARFRRTAASGHRPARANRITTGGMQHRSE
jgi:threonyl-tRNA synthetase